MKKFIYISLTIVLIGCSQITSFKSEKNNVENNAYDLAIISTGNGKGNLEEGLGYPRISTIIKRAKRIYGENNVLYLDSGGNFSGTTIANRTKGASSVAVLNGVGLKATTIGAGDFRYGLKGLINLQEKSNFKIIGTNIRGNGKSSFLTEYLIEEIGDKKIGIIGLISPEFYKDLTGEDIEKISIEDPIMSASLIVKKLKKEKVDFIIALSSLGNDGRTNKEWTNRGLAESTKGIDLIIDSGKNKGTSFQIKKTLIISSEEQLGSVGVVQIGLNSKLKNKKLNYKLIKTEDIYRPKENRRYKVKKGDTLYSLAKNNNIQLEELIKANLSIIDGKTIEIGKEYNIPIFNENLLAQNKDNKLLDIREDKNIKAIIAKINKKRI